MKKLTAAAFGIVLLACAGASALKSPPKAKPVAAKNLHAPGPVQYTATPPSEVTQLQGIQLQIGVTKTDAGIALAGFRFGVSGCATLTDGQGNPAPSGIKDCTSVIANLPASDAVAAAFAQEALTQLQQNGQF
jgi:hypothetical protein